MIKARVRLEGSKLVPVDKQSEDMVRKLPTQGVFSVELVRDRSKPMLRLYWAVLGSIVDAGGYDEPAEDLHDSLKVIVGRVRYVRNLWGIVEAKPDTIKESAMSQADFRAYFNSCMAAIKDYGLWDYIAPDLQAKLNEGKEGCLTDII